MIFVINYDIRHTKIISIKSMKNALIQYVKNLQRSGMRRRKMWNKNKNNFLILIKRCLYKS